MRFARKQFDKIQLPHSQIVLEWYNFASQNSKYTIRFYIEETPNNYKLIYTKYYIAKNLKDAKSYALNCMKTYLDKIHNTLKRYLINTITKD